MITDLTGVHCCGNICFDIPVWPAQQFRWNATEWVEHIAEGIGGNGGNTSYTLARLGVPVRLHGMAGRDSHGDRVLEILRQAGVDTTGVGRSDRSTTCTVCLVHPNAERMFFQMPGASYDVDPDALDLTGDAFSHFHLANLFSLPKVCAAAPRLLERARSAGLTTSLDTGWDTRGRWLEDVGPCLPFADVFFVNDTEGAMIASETEPDRIAGRLRREGAGAILLKLGAGGCILYTGADRIHVAGHRVNALDTTGAGDSFAAGFFAGLHRGLDPEAAARIANAVGAMNVERLGAVGGVRSWDETISWLRDRGELQ